MSSPKNEKDINTQKKAMKQPGMLQGFSIKKQERF
jgi:hypothetical protein